MKRLSWLLIPVGVLVLCGLSWLLNPGPAGAETACRRLGTAFLLGAGLLAPFLARDLSPRTLCLEACVLAVGWMALFALAAWAGLEGLQAWDGAGIVAFAWAVAWSWTLPTRCFRARAASPLLFLVILGGLAGTPYLVEVRAAAVPGWVMSWNPLLRLHQGICGQDWLRSPLHYSRLGDKYFQYPQGWDGTGVLWISAAATLALALLWLLLSRRTRAAGSDSFSDPSA